MRTDFAGEARDRNRVAASMPPEVLQAAQRVAGRIGAGDLEGGERDVWLCHNVCELGATKMVDVLTEFRDFLNENRGEVIVLFLEPYVPPREIERVFREAGLLRYLMTLERDEPLPTVGELVRENKRVMVITENDADGDPPWYMNGFAWVQDTPLGAQKIKQLSCARNRGTPDSQILMLNHWADVFPPRSTPNKAFQTEREILRRARECSRPRAMHRIGVSMLIVKK